MTLRAKSTFNMKIREDNILQVFICVTPDRFPIKYIKSAFVYADNLTIRANHIASLRKIFKKQLALSFSVRVVPCI